MPIRPEQVIALSIAVLLSACTGERSEPEPAAGDARSVIGDPLQQALERAESVQGTVEQRAAELRERLEAEEGD